MAQRITKLKFIDTDMNCPKCGKEIADDSKFCRHCGYKFKDDSKAVSPVQQKLQLIKDKVLGLKDKQISLKAILLAIAIGVWVIVLQNFGLLPGNREVEVANTVDVRGAVDAYVMDY